MSQPKSELKPRALLKQRRVERDHAGQRSKVVAVHEVENRRARYAYQIEYPPHVHDAELARDLRTLSDMADDQASAQDIYDLLVSATITHETLPEYTAFIGNCHVDIVRPGSCRLLLNVWCEKVRLWHRHEWSAGGPLELPSNDVVEAHIRVWLEDLASP